jgi:hypothetical protein
MIQRFGRSSTPGAMNLNNHFHMLLLDGVYVDGVGEGSASFRWVRSQTGQEQMLLAQTIARRVGRYLGRRGPTMGNQYMVIYSPVVAISSLLIVSFFPMLRIAENLIYDLCIDYFSNFPKQSSDIVIVGITEEILLWEVV